MQEFLVENWQAWIQEHKTRLTKRKEHYVEDAKKDFLLWCKANGCQTTKKEVDWYFEDQVIPLFAGCRKTFYEKLLDFVCLIKTASINPGITKRRQERITKAHKRVEDEVVTTGWATSETKNESLRKLDKILIERTKHKTLKIRFLFASSFLEKPNKKGIYNRHRIIVLNGFHLLGDKITEKALRRRIENR